MTKRLKSINTSSAARVFEGEVVSGKMNQTIVVKVYRTFKHPLIGKTIRKFKKYKAHDETNNAKLGDYVRIAECRPISKTKHMVLKEVLKRAV